MGFLLFLCIYATYVVSCPIHVNSWKIPNSNAAFVPGSDSGTKACFLFGNHFWVSRVFQILASLHVPGRESCVDRFCIVVNILQYECLVQQYRSLVEQSWGLVQQSIHTVQQITSTDEQYARTVATENRHCWTEYEDCWTEVSFCSTEHEVLLNRRITTVEQSTQTVEQKYYSVQQNIRTVQQSPKTVEQKHQDCWTEHRDCGIQFLHFTTMVLFLCNTDNQTFFLALILASFSFNRFEKLRLALFAPPEAAFSFNRFWVGGRRRRRRLGSRVSGV